MKALLAKYYPFFVSAALMCLLLWFIYPHYQYYIDPDGTAYLTISQRYASGDYMRAINGYWSPWGCWLTAILIRFGMEAVSASVVINVMGGVGFLWVAQSLFLRFDVIGKMQWLMSAALGAFLCYAVFHQSFDDLWECFFLLGCLRLMLSGNFLQRPALWVLTGVLGTLAYFAKAYSFPFFMLNTVVCVQLLAKGNRMLWVRISATAIGVMAVCSMPWIWILHSKYGIWTTSTSGTLNTSWYLVGHPQWKEGLGQLLPPVYGDSPNYWEDPWAANGATPHFWNSFSLFGLQILRVGLNCWKFLVSLFQLSIFFPSVFLFAVLSLFHKKFKALFSPDLRIAVVSFLLFPAGYFLVNFEPRYLWYMLPLGMIMATVIYSRYLTTNKHVFFLAIFVGSFIFFPVAGMNGMYDEGKREYQMAQELKRCGIKGPFTSIVNPGTENQRALRLAYFSGNPFYSIPLPGISADDLAKEVRRYHIRYFFVFGERSGQQAKELSSLHLSEIVGCNIPGLKIYAID